MATRTHLDSSNESLRGYVVFLDKTLADFTKDIDVW
jgi:hypothetical protein